MKLHVAALALALVAAPAPVALAQDGGPQPAPAEALDARVARLVRQLGDRAYERREAAQRELVAIGRPALPALREAAQSQDPEVASRAAEAIEAIGGEVEPTRERERRELPRELERQELERGLEELPRQGGGPDAVLEELQRSLPKLFERFFERSLPGGEPRGGESENGWLRVWRFGGPSTEAETTVRELGLTVERPGAALRAQLELPEGVGLVVTRLEATGRAARSGVQRYDVLVAVDGRAVREVSDLEGVIARGGALELVRKAKRTALELKPRAPTRRADPPRRETPKDEPAPERPRDPRERSF